MVKGKVPDYREGIPQIRTTVNIPMNSSYRKIPPSQHQLVMEYVRYNNIVGRGRVTDKPNTSLVSLRIISVYYNVLYCK